MQLHGPTGVLQVLPDQLVSNFDREAGKGTVVTSEAVLKGVDRIMGLKRFVVPALKGRDTECYGLSIKWMPPGFAGKFGEAFKERPVFWGLGQKVADD